jgi:acyl-coenzyme A synthetase/AMP-(fatty) acid ligase
VLEAVVSEQKDAEDLNNPKACFFLQGMADGDIDVKLKAPIGKWDYTCWRELVTELPKTAAAKIQRFRLRDARQAVLAPI